MNQNVDETFTELPSDNSHEDDAFFDKPLNRAPRSNVSSAKSKKSRTTIDDNLFGITEEDLESNMLGPRNRPGATSTPFIQNGDDHMVTDDDDLGFDPKKPKAASTKSTLFDDILMGTLSDTKRSTGFTPTPAARRSANSDERRPMISRQSTDTTTENSAVQRPKTSTGRRGSSLSSAINPDPLGLFSQPAPNGKEQPPPPQLQQQQQSQQIKKRGTTADWLGLYTAETDEEQATPRAQNTNETPRATSARDTQELKSQIGYDILKLNEPIDPNETGEHKIVPDDAKNVGVPMAAITSSTAQGLLQLNAINLDARNAFTMLQQQEPQLNLAIQMKQQERALLNMQRRQDTLLQQQERQFQSLLQQQLQRQQHLEESIKQQQQRINANIQLMLSQPAPALEGYVLPMNQMDHGVAESINDEQATTTNARTESHTATQAALDLIQVETDMRRLELEKLRLEELVANMKAKYESEIEMIEATHKKQLEVLDEHTATMESRLRGEITEITNHFKEKLTTLDLEHQTKKEILQAEIGTLRHDHEDELRRMRKAHEQNLESLREEHKRVLESVQLSKLHEFAILQDNHSYLDTLKAASANLSEATTGLQDLREHLHSKLELVNQEKQSELDARERHLGDKERRLQLCEATTEQEKAHLMKLVSTLEQQLSSLSKESNEENWQLRLKLSAFEADKVAFEREREYVREQIQRDEKRLAELKERQVADLQRMNLELQEERRQLNVERIKFETQKKLRLNGDSVDRDRYEMETAIKCAQDATRQADTERKRYHALQQEQEQRKRDLVNAENELRDRREQLNDELNACHAAKQQAQEAAQRARLIEQNYHEKLQALQTRSREMAEKEAFLAQERKLLAQQRIAIKEAQTKTRNRTEDIICDAGGGDAGGGLARLKNVKEKLQAAEDAHKRQEGRTSLNLVDRLLDDNIAESMQRMHVRTPPGKASIWTDSSTKKRYGYSSFDDWPPMGLDDDSKSLVLNSNFDALDMGFQRRDITEL